MSKKSKKQKPVPPTNIKDYALSCFRGRSGWKYISISKCGSTFGNVAPLIVSVQAHKTIPTLADTGRYVTTDSALIRCIKLKPEYSNFLGIVVDKLGNVYVEDSLSSTEQELSAALIPPVPEFITTETLENFFEDVTGDEIAEHSAAFMKQLTESISKTNEKFNNLSKYFKPKEEGEDPELDKLCKELEKVDITDDKALEKGLDIIKSLTNTAVDAAKESTEAVQETMQAIKEQEEIPVAHESPQS